MRISLNNLATIKADDPWDADDDNTWLTCSDAASWPDPMPADDLDTLDLQAAAGFR